MAAMLMVAMFVLVGCSPKYHCSKFPTGSCKNMSQVYGDTGSGFRDYRENQTDEKHGGGKKTAKQVVVSNAVKGVNELQPGDPVLTKPQVLRVWVKPWEDKDKDLNYSYIYLRTKEAEWTVLK